MKLEGKRLNVGLRVSMVCLFAVGVPKLFFVVQSQAQQEQIIQRTVSAQSVLVNNGETVGASTVSKDDASVALVTNQMQTWGTDSAALEHLVAQGMTIHTILVPFAYQTELVQKRAAHAPFLAATVSIVSGETDSLFSAKNLMGCDTICLDLQDTGVRTDGYVAVVYAALRAARDYNKELIIIDHPNPLGGTMEGWCSRTSKLSDETLFLARIPLRHGMTLGELARYMNRALLSSPATLKVIPLPVYDRFTPIDARAIRVPFSRNIATLGACRCYSFLGILGEIAPFDVALGTDNAFQALLLPEKSTISRAAWQEYRTMLKEHAIESRLWRHYSARKKIWLSGVRLFIPDGVTFSSTQVLMATLTFFKKRGVVCMPSLTLDQSAGTSLVRRFIQDEVSWASGLDEVQKSKNLFFKEAFSSYLYKPLPREVQLVS